MDYTLILGMSAAVIMTAALIPQVIKTYRTKSAKDISWGRELLLTAGFTLFAIYGFIVQDIPVIFMNSVSLILVICLLIMKKSYDQKKPS